MIIGVVIPTRGRKRFLAMALKQIGRQTVQPHHIRVVDFEADGEEVDITRRYRQGCNDLLPNCDVVLFWEDDDWYAPNYIETMVAGWLAAGKPSAFGIANTTYYHIFERRYFTISHPGRASACCTMVTKDVLNIRWPSDDYPYLDIELWNQLAGKTFVPQQPICIGIKHGLGLVGGGCHNGSSKHYTQADPDGRYLRSIVGEDFNFYEELRHAQILEK